MFKKRSAFIVSLLSLCFILVISHMFRITKRSRKKYLKVVHSVQPLAREHYGASKRSQVTKDLWLQKDGQLLHYLVKSGDSILHLNQNKRRSTKAVEEMHDITCFLQQKKYYFNHQNQETQDSTGKPMQQVCILKMSSGKYNYYHNQFFGEDVIVQVYEATGHELNDSVSNGRCIMEGHCDHVRFALTENTPHIKTFNLTANIYTQKETL